MAGMLTLKRLQLTKRSFTLVEMMIIMAVIVILVSIAIPNVLKARIAANDVVAQRTLKAIAAALENYVTINGLYPDSTDYLTNVTPPYLNKNFFAGTHVGFTFEVNEMTGYSYTISATPVVVGSTGTTSYTIVTGGTFVE